MWKTRETEDYVRQSRGYGKKRKKQLDSVTDNLLRMLEALDQGAKLNPPAYNFIRAEPGGVYRIAESGSAVAATRLYFYPDEASKTLYLLTIGDKNTQSDDIRNCVRWAAEIREDLESKGDDDGDKGDEQDDQDE